MLFIIVKVEGSGLGITQALSERPTNRTVLRFPSNFTYNETIYLAVTGLGIFCFTFSYAKEILSPYIQLSYSKVFRALSHQHGNPKHVSQMPIPTRS